MTWRQSGRSLASAPPASPTTPYLMQSCIMQNKGRRIFFGVSRAHVCVSPRHVGTIMSRCKSLYLANVMQPDVRCSFIPAVLLSSAKFYTKSRVLRISIDLQKKGPLITPWKTTKPHAVDVQGLREVLTLSEQPSQIIQRELLMCKRWESKYIWRGKTIVRRVAVVLFIFI